MASKTYINKDICITSGESGEIDSAEITFNKRETSYNAQGYPIVSYNSSSGIFNSTDGLTIYTNGDRDIKLQPSRNVNLTNNDITNVANIYVNSSITSGGNITSGGGITAEAITVKGVTWDGAGLSQGTYTPSTTFPTITVNGPSLFNDTSTFDTNFPTSTLPTSTSTTSNSIVNKAMNDTWYGRLITGITNTWASTNNFTGPTTLSGATTNISSATTTLSGATTTLSGATTTLSGATTTLSGATTNISSVTTTLSGATTNISSATTTLSGATTNISSATTTLSGATTNITGSLRIKSIYNPYLLVDISNNAGNNVAASGTIPSNPVPGTVLITQYNNAGNGTVTLTLPQISESMVGCSITIRRIYSTSITTANKYQIVAATPNSSDTIYLSGSSISQTGTQNIISGSAATTTATLIACKNIVSLVTKTFWIVT